MVTLRYKPIRTHFFLLMIILAGVGGLFLALLVNLNIRYERDAERRHWQEKFDLVFSLNKGFIISNLILENRDMLIKFRDELKAAESIDPEIVSDVITIKRDERDSDIKETVSKTFPLTYTGEHLAPSSCQQN